MDNQSPAFVHRSCYVNFAEHLQNSWNVNVLYPEAPNRWSQEDWRRFLTMVESFGFNCLEYWLVPTLFHAAALEGGGIYTEFAETMRQVNEIAHDLGLKTKYLCIVNTIGPEWYFACPRDPADKDMILRLWRHWARELAGTDIVGLFPGDPGGCNRNGCTHETYIDLALELTELIKQENPAAAVEIGTWGTPFWGWGSDMLELPGWDGTFGMLQEASREISEESWQWRGTPARAREAVAYLLRRLPDFPQDTLVAINLGFSPDGHTTHGGDARPGAREIAKLRQITTWDYSLSEGELVCYPHWRLPRMAARRREEQSAAPYVGGMSYTMTPKLNLLTTYAAGRFFVNPAADPDLVSWDFCNQVFGEEHASLGELFEAFEVVEGWGHHPRRQWSKEVLLEKYEEIIERLEAADVSGCSLPLFPDPETYRQELLWFARRFRELAGPEPDRERIRREYWDRALAIYEAIPMSADERAEDSARRFSEILA